MLGFRHILLSFGIFVGVYLIFFGLFFTKEQLWRSGTYEKDLKEIKNAMLEMERDLHEIQRKLKIETSKLSISELSSSSSELVSTSSPALSSSSSELNRLLREHHLGCFKDSADRDLPELQGLFLVNPFNCMTTCAIASFRFAGLQNGEECWCGNTLGKYGSTDECNTKCNGDHTHLCGGQFINSIYLSEIIESYSRQPFFSQFQGKTYETSIYCKGKTPYYRSCKFTNLYYDMKSKTHIFVKGPNSVISIEGDTLLEEMSWVFELNTAAGIPEFRLQIQQSLPVLPNQIMFAAGKSVLFSRFLPYNIMHLIHDDLLGLFFTLIEYFPSEDPNYPFDLNTNLVILDEHPAASYIQIVQYFSNQPLRHHSTFPKDGLICYEVAVAGLSKRANWYQYGFGRPQGPIPEKHVSGKDVRQFANFVLARTKLPPIKYISEIADPVICIYSRTKNRLILNEKELAERLQNVLFMRSIFIRLEEMEIEEIFKALGHCAITVGMHGSILILNMFLPKNALTIELYPFGVPSENYTPYRTLANLPGAELKYIAWENKHRENTVYFKSRHRLLGGIEHLPVEEQEKIIESTRVPLHHCCEDPYWLFKIYQDTTVHLDELEALIKEKI